MSPTEPLTPVVDGYRHCRTLQEDPVREIIMDESCYIEAYRGDSGRPRGTAETGHVSLPASGNGQFGGITETPLPGRAA